MVDPEVLRLRRLRASALRLRSIARALSATPWGKDADVLNRGCCAAWRLARSVSGRLRAHPNASYQKDPGAGVRLMNEWVAAAVALGATSRADVMAKFAIQLAAVLRDLDDARSLTWLTELSDTLGRSQRELQGLVAGVCQPRPAAVDQVLSGASATAGDWPFLAI